MGDMYGCGMPARAARTPLDGGGTAPGAVLAAVAECNEASVEASHAVSAPLMAGDGEDAKKVEGGNTLLVPLGAPRAESSKPSYGVRGIMYGDRAFIGCTRGELRLYIMPCSVCTRVGTPGALACWL